MITKASVLVPFSDEAIVDYQLGTPEEQAAAAARLEASDAAMWATWRSLPWRVRAWRRLRGRVVRVREYVHHLGFALLNRCDRESEDD